MSASPTSEAAGPEAPAGGEAPAGPERSAGSERSVGSERSAGRERSVGADQPAAPGLDDLGEGVAIEGPPGRVVSLVPSLTESVALSAPGLLVGATDYCTHPAELASPGSAAPSTRTWTGSAPSPPTWSWPTRRKTGWRTWPPCARPASRSG